MDNEELQKHLQILNDEANFILQYYTKFVINKYGINPSFPNILRDEKILAEYEAKYSFICFKTNSTVPEAVELLTKDNNYSFDKSKTGELYNGFVHWLATTIKGSNELERLLELWVIEGREFNELNANKLHPLDVAILSQNINFIYASQKYVNLAEYQNNGFYIIHLLVEYVDQNIFDIDVIKQYIASGLPIDVRITNKAAKYNGKTALEIAVDKGLTEIVELLNGSQAEVDKSEQNNNLLINDYIQLLYEKVKKNTYERNKNNPKICDNEQSLTLITNLSIIYEGLVKLESGEIDLNLFEKIVIRYKEFYLKYPSTIVSEIINLGKHQEIFNKAALILAKHRIGVDILQDGYNMLNHAIDANNIKLIELLMKKGIKDFKQPTEAITYPSFKLILTPIAQALSDNKINIVNILLKNNITNVTILTSETALELNIFTAIRVFGGENKFTIMDQIPNLLNFDQEEVAQGFLAALEAGSYEFAKKFVEKGFDPNYNDGELTRLLASNVEKYKNQIIKLSEFGAIIPDNIIDKLPEEMLKQIRDNLQNQVVINEIDKQKLIISLMIKHEPLNKILNNFPAETPKFKSLIKKLIKNQTIFMQICKNYQFNVDAEKIEEIADFYNNLGQDISQIETDIITTNITSNEADENMNLLAASSEVDNE